MLLQLLIDIVEMDLTITLRFPVDSDPCIYNNGGCAQKCINYNNEPLCQCYTGYQLIADSKSCRGKNSKIAKRYITIMHVNNLL